MKKLEIRQNDIFGKTHPKATIELTLESLETVIQTKDAMSIVFKSKFDADTILGMLIAKGYKAYDRQESVSNAITISLKQNHTIMPLVVMK